MSELLISRFLSSDCCDLLLRPSCRTSASQFFYPVAFKFQNLYLVFLKKSSISCFIDILHEMLFSYFLLVIYTWFSLVS